MSLPKTLPGVKSSALVRFRYRRKALNAHGEDLLKVLCHVARYGFGLTVWQWAGRTYPVSGHSAHSMHYERYPDGFGKAFDVYGPQMYSFSAWVNSYAPQVDEGIHNPNLSRSHGRRVASSFWGPATWRSHVNHVHLGNDGPKSKEK